jgi:hypothetical protein
MVIEQYSIATTAKYNFPLPTIDTVFAKRFLEQSIKTLTNVHDQCLQLNQQTIQQAATTEMHTSTFQLRLSPLLLKPDHEETPIAACDTSTIKIGDTRTGILVAVRGANVLRHGTNYKYTRFGPFIFHVTEENKDEVKNTLQRESSATRWNQNQVSLTSLLQNPTRISSILERWLQATLSRTTSNGIILFDGSLTAGTADTSAEQLKTILSSAREHGNVALAFSKMTNLRINGRLITDVSLQQRGPYLLETTGLKPKPPIVLLGEVYVARLSRENYSFRLDIDKERPCQLRTKAVEKLLGNDLLSQGYPETLRLAHILCTFTATEVIAMQHFVARKYRFKIIERPDIHRLLFGPFGRGEPYS